MKLIPRIYEKMVIDQMDRAWAASPLLREITAAMRTARRKKMKRRVAFALRFMVVLAAFALAWFGLLVLFAGPAFIAVHGIAAMTACILVCAAWSIAREWSGRNQ